MGGAGLGRDLGLEGADNARATGAGLVVATPWDSASATVRLLREPLPDKA